MPVLLSDEELEALDGLPHLHRCLYIFGIRRYMDYETGIAGIKRKISYKSLAEEVYVNPRRGCVNTGGKSRDQVKRVLMTLEQFGLIKRKSIVTKDEKQLILECALADTDKYIQNKAAPYPPHSLALKAAPEINYNEKQEKPYKNSILQHGAIPAEDTKIRPERRHTQNEKAAPHPVSDTLHNITLHCAQDFLNLLARQGFYLNQLHGNKKTLAMVHAWVKAGITLEEAKIGINHVNAQLGKPPDTPTYYNKPVLQVRQDFKNAEDQTHEITNNAKPDRTHKPNRPKNETLVERTRRELQESIAESAERLRHNKH